MGKTTMKDLTGMRFHRLMVFEDSGKRNYKGSVVWRCRCDCGNEIEVPSCDLISGNNVSCGCYRIQNAKNLKNHLTLVDGTCIEMLKNRKYRCDNSTGHAGVYLRKNGKYRAYIGLSGKKYHLGIYDTYDEAVDVRERAEKILFEGLIAAHEEWQQSHEAGETGDSFCFEVEHKGRLDFELRIVESGRDERGELCH